MNGNQKWRADLGVMDVGLVDDPGYAVGTGQLAGDLRQHGASSRTIGTRTRSSPPTTSRPARRCGGRRTTSIRRGRRPPSSAPAHAPRSSPTPASTSAASIRQTGTELWRLSDNSTQVKVPTPVVAGDLVIVTGGYPPGGRPIYAIRPGGSGELGAEGAGVADRARRAVHRHAARVRRHPLRSAPTTAS